MQPIGFFRLIGHTDNTGPEKHNVDLGDRRARAVKEGLENMLKEDILKGRITNSDFSGAESGSICANGRQ
jgi:outer membrane protein OmpA-like peptidoglycan-associated protein